MSICVNSSETVSFYCFLVSQLPSKHKLPIIPSGKAHNGKNPELPQTDWQPSGVGNFFLFVFISDRLPTQSHTCGTCGWACTHELEAFGEVHLSSAVNQTCTPAHCCLLHSACHLCACLRFTAALWRLGSLLILSKSGQNQQLEDTVIQTLWKPADLSGIGLQRTALPGGALFSRVSRD